MRDQSLQFDHREIVVIFSLFIFVSLLMFTVGILVGKGITTAKYEGKIVLAESGFSLHAPVHAPIAPEKKEVIAASPLNLIPAKPRSEESLSEPDAEPLKNPEAEKLLQNPKIRPLLEPSSSSLPQSFSTGRFTVQIGSYPSEKDAAERVESLKKLGFPHAYFSAKEMSSNNTWYRVWLGYFPDYQSAKQSGEILREKGEVKHYLIRKAEYAG